MPNTAVARIAAPLGLDEIANPLGEAVLAAYRNAGSVGNALKNALHGVWLHHPLHPVLTDIPIGAWSTTVALDAKTAAGRRCILSTRSGLRFGVRIGGRRGLRHHWSD